MNGSGAFGVIASLFITVGALLIVLRLIRRLQPGSNATDGVRLQVLRRINVAPKQGVALLRVADRVLVVSIAEGGTRLLTELAGPDLDEALVEPAPARERSSQRERLRLADAWRMGLRWLGLFAVLVSMPTLASQADAQQDTPPSPVVDAPGLPQIDFQVRDGANEFRLSGAVGLVVFLGALTLLPAIMLLMTSFTRTLIVLHFLRTALGTQSTPPGQVLVAIAILLTGVVMSPVLEETNRTALQPYFDGEIDQVEAYKLGVAPFREFMYANTREQDLVTFLDLGQIEAVEEIDDVPIMVMISAFVTSELRSAFQMGFVIFLPFVVVDLIVASVLMSMGMFMLPPIMISLPFKLLLFVLADGWTLVVQHVVASFRF